VPRLDSVPGGADLETVMPSRPTNNRIPRQGSGLNSQTEPGGSEAEGARSGWPPGGGGSAGVSWATRVARAPRVPSASEPPSPLSSSLKASASSSEAFSSPLVSDRAPSPQGAGLEPSQSPGGGRGENGRGVAEAPYPEHVAPPHTSPGNGDAKAFLDASVFVGWDLGFQAHFDRPPEPIAEPEPELETDRRRPAEGVQLEFPCPTWAVVGECEDGHHFAKDLICNREWCRSCGGVDGRAHQRRKAAWLPRACQMRVIGSFVLTIPPEIRDRYRTKAALGKLGTAAKRMLQRHGFNRGLRRWHIFGEDHPGEGLQGDGLPPYHPHLNILVEAGFLELEILEVVKDSWAGILKVDRDRINVHYQFATTVPDRLHAVKYVLRPTFTDVSWDEELAWELLGFHNSQAWGHWDNPPAWDVPAGDDPGTTPAMVAMEQGRCPVDDTPITWGGVVQVHLLAAPWWQELGGGYRRWTGLARDGPDDDGR